MLARNRSLPPEISPASASLTETVCWSRMQTEAGQELQAIVERKELERSAGNGVFCWGVGNAPSRSIPELARTGTDVDVVFSIMKSRPKTVDVAPSRLRIWRSYFDHFGREQPLPPSTLITSRADAGTRVRNVHYALMCRSDQKLRLGDFGPFDPSAYRNVSDTAGAVGASQVTALLRRVSDGAPAPTYKINLKAKLGQGYWVRLGDPIDLTADRRSMLERVLANLSCLSQDEWLRMVRDIRSGPSTATELQPRLF